MTQAVFSQEPDSIQIQNNMVRIRTQGVALLGSGINESEARVLALTDAKRQALESAGTYLESHTTVLNHILVKDEIIMFSGGLLKVDVLEETREIVGSSFAIKITIDALIDVDVLNQRIADAGNNRDLLAQLESERERNKELESRLAALQESLNQGESVDASHLVDQITASEWFQKAYNERDNQKKIEYYSQAIRLDPEYTLAYINRATIRIYVQEYVKAQEDYSRAIGLKPDHTMAISNRGYVSARLGEYDKAMDDFLSAVSLQPDNPMIYYNLACVYSLNEDTERAIKYLDKALFSGFRNTQWIKDDTDLQAVRETEAFQRLLEKYNLTP